MVLSIIGWIFAGAGILVLLFLLIPVVVAFSYKNEEFTVSLRLFGIIKIKLFPQKEQGSERRANKKKRKAAKSKKNEDAAGTKPKRTVRQWIYLIKRIFYSAGAAKGLALKALRVYDLEFILAVHADEAGDTAVRFGQMQAVVGGVRALLENYIKIRYKALIIVPDFTGRYPTAPIVSCKIAACPVILLLAGIVGLRGFLRFRKVFGRAPLSRRQQKELEEKREKLRAERAAQHREQQNGTPCAGGKSA